MRYSLIDQSEWLPGERERNKKGGRGEKERDGGERVRERERERQNERKTPLLKEKIEPTIVWYEKSENRMQVCESSSKQDFEANVFFRVCVRLILVWFSSFLLTVPFWPSIVDAYNTILKARTASIIILAQKS